MKYSISNYQFSWFAPLAVGKRKAEILGLRESTVVGVRQLVFNYFEYTPVARLLIVRCLSISIKSRDQIFRVTTFLRDIPICTQLSLRQNSLPYLPIARECVRIYRYLSRPLLHRSVLVPKLLILSLMTLFLILSAVLLFVVFLPKFIRKQRKVAVISNFLNSTSYVYGSSAYSSRSPISFLTIKTQQKTENKVTQIEQRVSTKRANHTTGVQHNPNALLHWC